MSFARTVDCLTPFEDAGVLDALDVEVARTLLRLAGVPAADLTITGDAWTAQAMVALGAAMATRAPGHGHICFDVTTASRTPVSARDPGHEVTFRWPETREWLAALRASHLVRGPGETRDTPLVLDAHGRLYLDRYWGYEERLSSAIAARLAAPPPGLDLGLLERGLREVLPVPPDRPDHRPGVLCQRHAVTVALSGRFAVISGGPGTGKTTTVTALIALLIRLEDASRPPGTQVRSPRIRLLAPTGKAAARMAEAVREGVVRLAARVRAGELDQSWAPVLGRVPAEAATIHRALGANPDRPTRFRHGRENPLPADLVVVDEASMVDFALMTRLVEAVLPEARLVLLGDRDQLASVEAGAVFGDLCATGEPGPRSVSPAMARRLRLVVDRNIAPLVEADGPRIRDAVVHLAHPFRYQAAGGIDQLARAVREGDSRAALEALDVAEETRLLAAGPADDLSAIRSLVVAGWRDALARPVADAVRATDDDARRAAITRAISGLDAFRVLCTHRQGPRGAEALNAAVREWLRDDFPGTDDWFPGLPVMVLENDAGVELFNGDVGVVLPDPAGSGRLLAVFPPLGVGRSWRIHGRGRLPAWEPVYAMTVHKSQGSQFDRVLVVLPPRDSPFVTRELIYTAITRARTSVTVAGPRDAFVAALGRRVQRESGLRRRLWDLERDRT